jgi:hypothetical protein
MDGMPASRLAGIALRSWKFLQTDQKRRTCFLPLGYHQHCCLVSKDLHSIVTNWNKSALSSQDRRSSDLLARARAEGYSLEVFAKPISPDVLLAKLNRHSF